MAAFVPPRFLYKYRCCDANALSLLASDKLYLSRIEAFNDPFEFLNPAATLEATRADDPDATFAKLDSEHRADKLHASMRVCALTEKCDDLLMWGHYTDCHKGFCIRFEFGNDGGIPGKLFPVEYLPTLPNYNKRIENSMDAVRIGTLTKYEAWSYEREWRIIGHVAEDKAHTSELLMPYNPRAITGIIFGLRTPSLHKELVRKVLHGHPQVQYFQAHKKHDAFALTIREVGAQPLASAGEPRDK